MATHNNVTQLSHAAHQVQEWIHDLASRPPFETEEQAYSYLRAVLHALRDRLTMEEAVHLASQLPMIVRGFYYEGWKPSRTPVAVRTQNEFFDLVNTNLGGTLPASAIDVAAGTHTVLAFLVDHVDPGEFRHVRGQLPRDLKELFGTDKEQ
jgi:uncharacterized protein (DUF2267 family)